MTNEERREERSVQDIRDTGAAWVTERELAMLCDKANVYEQAQQTIALLEDALVGDASDLWDVTTAIKKEMEGRSWITEGRGLYEWSDDDYRKEAGWAFEAVLNIIAKVQPPAARRVHQVLRKSKDGPARRLREAEQRAEQAEQQVATLTAERQAGADLLGEIIEKAMYWQDRAEQAQARERALRAAMDAAARAYDHEGQCLETCASWRGDDCDCGYVEAADDLPQFLRDSLAAIEASERENVKRDEIAEIA
jgi:hypothetical protein